MKYFNICLLFIICALCFGLSAAQDDAAPAPLVSPAKRIAALRRNAGKGVGVKPTTSTTAAPPSASEEGDEGDYNDEAGGEHGQQYGDEEAAAPVGSTTTTTTEPPKKVGPVIRPFRSNDDFLNSLKRRQQNAKKHRAEKVTSKPSKKTEEQQEDQEQEEAAAPAPAPAKLGGYKSNAALNRRKLAKPGKANAEPAVDDAAAEESEQQAKEETKPKRPIAGGRLALRKRN